jgi:hypothetical protein
MKHSKFWAFAIALSLFFTFKAMMNQMAMEAIANGDTFKDFGKAMSIVTAILLFLGARFTIFRVSLRFEKESWWFFAGVAIWTASAFWTIGFGWSGFVQFIFTAISLFGGWWIAKTILSVKNQETLKPPKNIFCII